MKALPRGLDTPVAEGGALARPLPRRRVRDGHAVAERHRLELQFRQSQKLESPGRLTGGLAHDFNNLLTVIRGQASFVASGLVAPEALAEALDQIQLAAERRSRLTRLRLTFSRQ